VRALILGAGPAPVEGDATSLWLLENDGQLLVERFANACDALGAKLTFAVRAQEIKRWRIDNVIRLAAPGAAVVPITGETAGAACTALLCVHEIDPDDELLILNSNEYLDIDYTQPIHDFRRRDLDAGVVIFPSIHPRYSYVRLDEDGLIVEAAEKNPISRHATPGFTWFRRGGDFIQSAQDMIRKDANQDGRYFISLTLNEMVLRQKRMGVFAIDSRRYHPLKSPRQLTSFEADDLMDHRA
jgi:hypothetical protein